MGLISRRKRNSSVVAKDRLKILLTAERIQCTPNMLIMLKNDMIQAASKYVSVNEKHVSVTYSPASELVIASFPLECNNHTIRDNKTNAKII